MYEFKIEHLIIIVLSLWLLAAYTSKNYESPCTKDMPDKQYGECIKMLQSQDYDVDPYFHN